MAWRASLFKKYFAFIVLLVSVGLVAGGGVNPNFSYQETRASLVKLQREKAVTAAVHIEQFVRELGGAGEASAYRFENGLIRYVTGAGGREE